MRSKQHLADLLIQRLERNGLYRGSFFTEAVEIIVFGSMAVGLNRPDSDIDILYIGNDHFKIKKPKLDLIGIPATETINTSWLQSELASHVACYGTWLKGTPQWKDRVRIGHAVVRHKRRRIAAFMNALPKVWFKLDDCFRTKYSIKLRREA